jgi:hypothetical protein
VPRLRMSGVIPLFLVYFYGMHPYSFTFTIDVHIMKVLYVKILKNLFDLKDTFEVHFAIQRSHRKNQQDASM